MMNLPVNHINSEVITLNKSLALSAVLVMTSRLLPPAISPNEHYETPGYTLRGNPEKV